MTNKEILIKKLEEFHDEIGFILLLSKDRSLHKRLKKINYRDDLRVIRKKTLEAIKLAKNENKPTN